MANSELSKLKILFIYDYFKNQVSAEGGKEAVSVSELISYLEETTGTTFERKSIYADISKINEYVQKSGQTNDSDWIYTEGKKYRRSELKDEILIDEARLIVDAISTTTFVDSDLCEKIIKMFPTYFPEGYQNRALYPHYEKIDRKSILLLNNIRSGIEEKRALKEIAYKSIKDSLDGKRIEKFNVQRSKFNEKCGAFVSLHKKGRLRGCIGHFGEDVPLHEVVAEMARSAAFGDPRFQPVTRDELDDLDIEISVLTPMRRIQSLDEFQLHKHGIYIRKGHRSGTFLPQVADEVNWTKEEFVGHCAQDKAGIGWDGWRDAELYVYEAIVF